MDGRPVATGGEGYEQQPPPQQPPPVGPGAGPEALPVAADPVEANPVEANTGSSRTAPTWPSGQVAGASASAMGLDTS